MLAVLAVIAAGIYATVAPLREETSAARVSERLTAVFKRPVRVADTDFRFSPTPRLIVRGIDVGGQFKADEISLADQLEGSVERGTRRQLGLERSADRTAGGHAGASGLYRSYAAGRGA